MSDQPTDPSRNAPGARRSPLLGPLDTTTGTNARSGGGSVVGGNVVGGNVVGGNVVGGNVVGGNVVGGNVGVVVEVVVVDVVVVAAALLELEVSR